MRPLALLPVLLLVGCSPKAGGESKPAAPAAAHEGEPTTAEEKAVARYILDNAADPKSVEFSRWGPDVSGKAFTDMVNGAAAKDAVESKRLKDAGPDKAAELHVFILSHVDPLKPTFFTRVPVEGVKAFVRVKYRSANRFGGIQIHDELYTASEGEPARVVLVGLGDDDWFRSLERRLTESRSGP